MSIVYFFPASMFVTINCLLPTESNANDFVDQIANIKVQIRVHLLSTIYDYLLPIVGISCLFYRKVVVVLFSVQIQ